MRLFHYATKTINAVDQFSHAKIKRKAKDCNFKGTLCKSRPANAPARDNQRTRN